MATGGAGLACSASRLWNVGGWRCPRGSWSGQQGCRRRRERCRDGRWGRGRSRASWAYSGCARGVLGDHRDDLHCVGPSFMLCLPTMKRPVVPKRRWTRMQPAGNGDGAEAGRRMSSAYGAGSLRTCETSQARQAGLVSRCQTPASLQSRSHRRHCLSYPNRDPAAGSPTGCRPVGRTRSRTARPSKGLRPGERLSHRGGDDSSGSTCHPTRSTAVDPPGAERSTSALSIAIRTGSPLWPSRSLLSQRDACLCKFYAHCNQSTRHAVGNAADEYVVGISFSREQTVIDGSCGDFEPVG